MLFGSLILPQFNNASSTASVSFQSRILTYTEFSFQYQISPLEIALYSPSLHFLPNTRRPDEERRSKILSKWARKKEMKKTTEVANSSPEIARPEERGWRQLLQPPHRVASSKNQPWFHHFSHTQLALTEQEIAFWITHYLSSQWKEAAAYSLTVMVSFPATKELKFKCKIS